MAISEAKAKTDAKWRKKAYEQITFEIRRDSKINADFIRAHAKVMGESVNGFLKRAVTAAIQRDNFRAGSGNNA